MVVFRCVACAVLKGFAERRCTSLYHISVRRGVFACDKLKCKVYITAEYKGFEYVAKSYHTRVKLSIVTVDYFNKLFIGSFSLRLLKYAYCNKICLRGLAIS